jgi:lipoprotein-anchoring transpeptidase ErfK/SrfK
MATEPTARAAEQGSGGAAAGRLPLLRAALLVLAAALLAAGCGGAGGPRAQAATTAPQAHLAHQAEPARSQHLGESIVATAIAREVPVYRVPGGARPFLRLRNPTSSGAPLVFLVRKRGSGWEQVYLPVRPDGSTGWIRDRDVNLAWNPYSIQVRLGQHLLIVRRNGRVVARYRAGVGRTVLPTPRGRYYIVELLKQPDPNGLYGPYAFGTSAFSHVLYSFGGGPGQIGVHGTNDPSSIGRSVSHGCIRISNAAITTLAHMLPLGTPIEIVR